MTRKEFLFALSALPFVGRLSERKECAIDADAKVETAASKIGEPSCTCGQALGGLDRHYFERSFNYAIVCPGCEQVIVIGGGRVVELVKV